MTSFFYLLQSFYAYLSSFCMENVKKKKKKEEEEEEILLPQELISEILLRLPSKSLLRFECVSKSWLSSISDPHFAKSHIDLTPSPTTTHLLICSESSPSQDIEATLRYFDDYSEVATFHFRWFPSFCISGSCRGFILFDKHPFLAIWNPLNGVVKQLHYTPSPLNDDTSRFVYGFGYVASTDDYLIVVASLIKYKITLLEIYSVRTMSWNEIKVTHFPYLVPCKNSGLLFNGAIHKLVDVVPHSLAILAFDLVERNFYEVPLPSDGIRHWDSYELRVIGGYLGLCCGGGCVEIWVMKEYKVRSSWTMCFYMDKIPNDEFYPIYLTKGGEYIGLNEFNELLILNDKGELLKHGGHCEENQIAVYTPSLLSLPSQDFGQQQLQI